MDFKDLDSEQLHEELVRHVGCDAYNFVEEYAGPFQPVQKNSVFDFTELFFWGRNLYSFQTTEKARNIIRGIIKILIDDVNSGMVRSKFKLENILINSYNHVALSVPASPLKIQELVDEQVKSKIYDEPLNCLKAVIVEICGGGVKRIPKDLAHLMLYLKDFETFWNSHRFVLNHPSCWSNLKFFNVIFALRSLVRNNDVNELTNAIGSAYPEGFVWKDVFSSHFIDNHPWNDFKDAASTLFSSKTFEDDGVGLLMYLLNLLEHPREYSNLDTIVKIDDLVNPSSGEVLEVVNFLFPLFLPKIVQKFFKL